MEHNVVFLFSSEHILMSFCFLPPAEKPAADTHTQPSRLSASSSSSDSSSSSSSSSSSDTSESDSGWETDSSYEKMSRRTLFSPSGLNLFKAADGAAGRAGEAGRDGAFPALSSDLKEVPALLPEEPASAGGVRDAPSPAHKGDWGVRWRDKGARARMCLISGDNFPFSPCSLSLCCIDEVYSTQYISFIKKHFMELIYSLIVGTMKLAWAKSFLFVFLSFFSRVDKRGMFVCVFLCEWRRDVLHSFDAGVEKVGLHTEAPSERMRYRGADKHLHTSVGGAWMFLCRLFSHPFLCKRVAFSNVTNLLINCGGVSSCAQ